MRILFVPLAPTHYFPMVPLLWAFRAAGHDVRVAAQPSVVDAVRRSGTVAVPVGHAYEYQDKVEAADRAIQERLGRLPADTLSKGRQSLPPDVLQWVIRQHQEVFVGTALAMADDLAAFARWWRPDLVVTDPLVLAAPLAAETVGAPLVRFLWGPGAPAASRVPPEQWPAEFLGLLERYGVEPRADYAACTVDPSPAGLREPEVPNRVPMRYVPYNGPGSVPEWLLSPSDRPRVCMTLGLSATEAAADGQLAGEEFFASLAGLDVEIVATLSASDQEKLGDPPAGVRFVDGLPLHLLLPTCDAIIQHGGAGTTLTAAALGVPQLVLGQGPASYLVAQRLVSTGAGVPLAPGQGDADGIKSVVAGLLSEDAPRKAARRLQEEILAQPTPAEVVGTLEQLV